MEFPECNSSHWKSKFIDDLPALFAKRVRKTLTGDSHSINYNNYTYGKFISSCIQEGLSLCNEFKFNQQISLKQAPNIGSILQRTNLPKKDYKVWKKTRIEKKERRAEHYREKKRSNKSRQKFNNSNTCHKVKEKIKNLDKDDNIKDSLCKIKLNFDSGKSEIEYSSHEESSTSEDLKSLHQEDYMSSDDNCLLCQQGLSCENEGEEDDLCKIYSLFKELSINVIDNDKVIEL
ncbi:hypothetical protein H5410_050700 [Solanum commersonii]|uniref:Uncharacterized protein n=1 Tax=Solanum commersonii TaxID=4109 RepID=A0A9J5WW68_SOLCO|nr:hypothetical protein H5410_050700 [Solanum commersonii]